MLSKLISPKVGVQMIRKELEKNLKKEINSFDIFYNHKEENLKFIIDNKGLLFDNPMLQKMIKEQALNQLDKKATLTALLIKCNQSDEITCTVFYLDENSEKKFVSYNL